MPLSFQDGTTNTIMISEHYARCDTVNFEWDVDRSGLYNRPPLFAHPITVELSVSGSPPQATSRIYGNAVPFQTRPCTSVRFRNDFPFVDCGSRPVCDPSLNQTPYAAGLQAMMADGSVRTISAAVRPSIFWAWTTLAGGEITGE